LCIITGFHACSLQPNSGAAGEYAGLSVIRAYHRSRGDDKRDICLIPVSAHGTNPAVSGPLYPNRIPLTLPFKSAILAGLKVVAVKSLPDGSLDLADLKEKAEKHRENLAACMVWHSFPPRFWKLIISRSHIHRRLACSRKALHRLARSCMRTEDKFTLTARI